MADWQLIEEGLKRGYSLDEVTDIIAKEEGVDPSYARERGFDSPAILRRLGYVKPEEVKPEKGFIGNVLDQAAHGVKTAYQGLLSAPGIYAGNPDAERIAGTIQAEQSHEKPKEMREAEAAFAGVSKRQSDFESVYGKDSGYMDSIGKIMDMLVTTGKEIVTNPKGMAYEMASQSGNMVAPMVGAYAGSKTGAVTGALLGPKGAAAGGAVGAGAGGFVGSRFMEQSGEFRGKVAERLSELGLEPTAENVSAIFQDKAWLDKTLEETRDKATGTAVTDGVLAAIGGLAVNAPIRAAQKTARAQLGATATAKQVRDAAADILASQPKWQKVAPHLKAGAIGWGGEPISEATGQQYGYGHVDYGDVGMEAFAAAGEGIGSVYAAAKGMRTKPTLPANVTPPPSITSASSTDDAIKSFKVEVETASPAPRGSFGIMDEFARFIESERSDLNKRRGLLAQQQQEARDMEAEFSELVKDEQIDQSYWLNDAQKQRDAERAREGGYDLALQQREEQQGRTVEQLAAASEAQGFGNEEPTAMQLAMQRAQQKALDNEFSGLLKQERASLNEMRANVKRVAGVPVEQISTPQLEENAQSDAQPNAKMEAIPALNDRHDAIQQERERLMQLRETRLEKQSNQPEQGAQHGAESHGTDGQVATPSVAGGGANVSGGGLDAAMVDANGGMRGTASAGAAVSSGGQAGAVPVAEQPTNVRALTENAAKRQATQLTNQGYPTVAYPHPTQAGMWAIGSNEEAEGALNKGEQESEEEVPAVEVRAPVKRKRPASNNIAQAIINLGGISTSLKTDILGDASIKTRPGLFTTNGTGDLGEIAAMLSSGFGFSQIDLNDPTDNSGAKQLADLIASSVNGETILNEEAMILAQQDEEFEQAKAEVNLQAQELGIKPIRGKRTIDIVQSEINAILAKREEMSRQKKKAQLLLDEVAEQELIEAFDLAMQEYHDETAISRDESRVESARLSAEESAQGDGDSVNQASPVAGRASPTEGGRGEAEVTPEFSLVGQTEEEAIAEEQARNDAEAKRQREEQDAENKRQADAERDSFNLSGSTLPADELAARGQEGLFEQKADPIAAVKATLDAAGVTGTDRTSTIAAVRRGDLTPEDVAEAHPAIAENSERVNTEDAGEELSYNRRNRSGSLKWSDIKDQEAALRVKEVTKAKVYQKPDYAALAEEIGPVKAHLVKQVYDHIAATPQTGRDVPTDAQLEAYIDAVNSIMDATIAWAKDAVFESQWRMTANGKTLVDTLYPEGWRPQRDVVVLLGGNRHFGGVQPGYKEIKRAEREIAKGWPGKREAWQTQGYKVVETAETAKLQEGRSSGNKVYYIEVGGRYFDSAPSKADGEKMIAEMQPWLLLNKQGRIVSQHQSEEQAVEAARNATKRGGSGGISDKGIAVENAERVGPARRMEGENVTSDQLKETFGFRGVNFGTWMKGKANDGERQLHLNHAYDAFLDLAEIIGVPPKAMSLNGMLGLAIGAQGNGKYAAHFVPGVNEINLTRTSGAGSLAHEFGHALDHYFARLGGLDRQAEPFLTEHTGKPAQGELRPEILDKFDSIVKEMNKRKMTPEEYEAEHLRNVERFKKNIAGWLKAVRHDFEIASINKVTIEDGKAKREKAISKLDALIERIRDKDLGDGRIAIGRYESASPVVMEIRELYKETFGRQMPKNNILGLQSNIDSLVYATSKRDADNSHTPQVSTDYAKNALALDKDKGGKPYWSTNLEKFARAFDAFVTDTLDAKAAKNSYLSHAGREGDTVPAGEERKAINEAFKALVDAIETKETDSGVAMFSRADGNQPWYFSALEDGIRNAKLKTQPASQWVAWIRSQQQFKKEEVEWSGILDHLASLGKERVTSGDLAQWVAENGVRVEEVVLGEDRLADLQKQLDEINDRYNAIIDEHGVTVQELPAAAKKEIDDLTVRHDEIADRIADTYHTDYATKHASGNLVLPGGTDHREIVLTVPSVDPYNESDSTHYGDVGKGKQIAWTRVNTRTDADGNKVLFVEEIQSQRNQHGRTRGFAKNEVRWLVKKPGDKTESSHSTREDAEAAMRTLARAYGDTPTALGLRVVEGVDNRSIAGVPTAPFVSTKDGKPTDSYIPLTLKRLIAYAVDTGHDAIAWTTGEQQADRYDLSKQIDSITVWSNGEGAYHYDAKKDGRSLNSDSAPVTPTKLEEIIGKDLAEKAIADITAGRPAKYSGLDLKVGGGWTASMYGDASGLNAQGKPSMIAQAARKLGAEVSSIQLGRKIDPYIKNDGGVYVVIDDISGDIISPEYGYESQAQSRLEQIESERTQQPSFPITDQMREQASKGMPLFQRDKAQAGTSAYPLSKDQSAAERLNRNLADHFKDSSWENAYVQRNLPDSFNAVAEAARAAFGTRVVGITATEQRFNQFNGVNLYRTAYVNLGAKPSFVNIAGHEIYHSLEKERPDLHQWFVAQARKHFRNFDEYQAKLNALVSANEQPYTREKAESELLADFTGDALADPKFLAQLAEADGSKFRRLLNAVAGWLKLAGEKLTGKNLGSSAYFNDVNELRKFLNRALIAYSSNKPIDRILALDEPRFMTAWHGSPHDHDGFDSSKIGTGEGAQAYGWGHYFAGAREVAEWYRKTLSARGDESRDSDLVVSTLKRMRDEWGVPESQLKEKLVEWFSAPAWNGMRERHPDFDAFISQHLKRGRLYQVELAPEQDEYLDWDKPLSEQSEKVREALIRAGVIVDGKYGDGFGATPMFPGWSTFTGESIHRRIVNREFEKQREVTAAARKRAEQAASEYLQSIGIRGIRYLDGSSRSAGNGTSNYVIFDSADVEITAKESRRASNDLDFTQPQGSEPLRKTSFGYANDTHNLFHVSTFKGNDGDVSTFDVYDTNTGEQLGFVSLGLRDGQITTLVAIEAEQKNVGFGEQLLRSLVARNPDGIYIINMLPEAVPFWQKMGVSLDEHFEGVWEHGNGVLTEEAIQEARDGKRGLAAEDPGGRQKESRGNAESESGRQANNPVSSKGVTNETTPANAGVSVSAPTESVRRIQAVVEWFKSQFKGATALDIRVVSTTQDIPARFRPSPFAEGVFHDEEGVIYLVAMNLRGQDGNLSERRAWQVLLHEAVGHYGLARMLGNKFASILKAVKQATHTNGRVNQDSRDTFKPGDKDYATWDAVKLRYPDATDAEIAQEVLARMAETDPGSSVLGYAVAVVRQWVRDVARAMGINLAVSTSELRDLVAKASGYMRRGDNLAEEHEPSGLVASSTGVAREGGKRGLESRAATVKPQGPIWSAPEMSRTDNIIYTMQDKNIDLKRVQQAIKEAVGEIRDDIDAYLQEELFHGRAAKITEEFLDKEVNPLISLMRASKVSMDELETFLWARHAKERNAQIAKINEAMPDGGSGLTNKQADDLMAGKDVKIGDKTIEGVKPNRKELLSNLAGRVDAITRGNRALLERYSLESADTLNAWDGAYKHYVPLHREDAESHLAGMGTGQGYSVKGSSSKRATGSSRPVENILANLALQRERIITRGEKNRVAQSLYGLAKEMPNADLWEVDVKPTMRTTAMIGGREQVVDAIDPAFRSKPNVVFARFNGEDRFVVFNEHNERALRMAEALKNLDADDISHLLGEVSRWTRYFASINTQYNPIFGVTNLVRDVQTGLLNLKSTPIEGKQKELMGNLTHALPAVFKALRADRKGQSASGSWAQLWEEFQEVGGQTGYRDMFRNSQERAEALQSALDPTWWQKTWWGKAATVGGVLAVPEQAFLDKVGKPLMELLSDYNTMMENGIRLAAYKVALDTGMTQARAASLAKNLTVNFNRKGQAARQVGAMYAFFNASIQGTARMAETLNHGAKPGELLGKAGKQIVYGGLLLGAVQAMLLMAAGFDDEEPPEFVRDRNIIIPTGNGKYVSIPMPLGFHVLPAISRISIEFTAGGFKKPGEHLVHIMNVLLDSFNPIGNAGLSMQTVAPTVLDPIAALTENKDWSGRQIARQDFSKLNPTPGHTRAKDTASSLSRGLAYALNYLSGGGEYGIGVVSPTPDQIDYLLGQLTGGVGREVGKVLTTGEAMTTGEDLPPHKIPLVGRFYGDTTGQSSEASKFYGTLEKLSEHKGTLDRMKDAHDVEAYREYAKEHPESRLYARAARVQRELASLRKLKRKMIERNADRAKVRQIEDRMRTLMTRFNQSVSEQKGNH